MDKAIENFLAAYAASKAGGHLEAYLEASLEAYLDRCEPIIREEAERKDLYSISEHSDLLEEGPKERRRFPKGKPLFTQTEIEEFEKMTGVFEGFVGAEEPEILDLLEEHNDGNQRPLAQEQLDFLKLSNFGEGEWMSEPDHMEFEYREIECYILRNLTGSLCGYVTVPNGHEWEGKDYDDIKCEIHGGLTFGDYNIYLQSPNRMNDRKIDKKSYIVGFDCAHSMDISPSVDKLMKEARGRTDKSEAFERALKMREKLLGTTFRPTYKNIAFVTAEIESLVDQMLDGVKDE